jgi:Uncharacterized conserved protein
MFKHLKYVDGTSDKFWEIQTAGSTHTVTYGRNGTAGQSKSKTFDSEEACLKDAEKLIAEKTKKGYSEDGNVGADSKEKGSAVRQPTAASQRKEEAVAALKLLIKEARTEDIIPFLDEYSSGNLEILKKKFVQPSDIGSIIATFPRILNLKIRHSTTGGLVAPKDSSG